MKFSQKTVERIEELLHLAGYKVRYEKGAFRGGACMVEDQRLVVINKFFPAEARAASLAEIFLGLELEGLELNDVQSKFVKDLRKTIVA